MRAFLIAVCLGAVLAGCRQSGKADHIQIAGSTAFGPTADKLAKAYIAKHPGVRIDIQANGSMVGINSAKDGTADIGMADIPELPPEAQGLKSVIVAKDGIAVVVHPSNAAGDLTLEQVGKIFSGAITNWKDLGGPDHAITAIVRENSSGTRKSFDKILGITGKVPKTLISYDSNGSIRTAVANDPHAISYVTIALVDKSVKPLKIAGVEPKNENVVAGKYPISRPVFLLTRGEPQLLTKAYIDFAMSPEGQKIISDDGLIPVK